MTRRLEEGLVLSTLKKILHFVFSKKSFSILKRRYPNTFGKLYNGKKLVLASNFDDTSFIRNRLAFKLWEWFDAKNHLKIETFFVVLFLEGKFHGLYTAIDHVNKSLFASQGQNPLLGTLYKIIENQYKFDDYSSADVKESMEIKFSDSKDFKEAFNVVGKFVDLFTGWEKKTFDDDFEKVARREDFEDWWVFASLIHASDSTWKNAYLYHEKGGKWRYLPWDFNASFGQFTKGPSMSRLNFSKLLESTNMIPSKPKNLPKLLANHNRLFKLFLDHPTIQNRLYQRAIKLTQEEWKLTKIENQIDLWVSEIASFVKKDQKKWKKQQKKVYGASEKEYRLRSFENEIQLIKTWIKERWQYTQTQLN